MFGGYLDCKQVKMLDKRGIFRGACTVYEDCEDYTPGTVTVRCEYCDCVPVKHVKVATQNFENPGENPPLPTPAHTVASSPQTTNQVRNVLLVTLEPRESVYL